MNSMVGQTLADVLYTTVLACGVILVLRGLCQAFGANGRDAETSERTRSTTHMRLPERLIIVQRYQPRLYETLRQKHTGIGQVVVDRRVGERRRSTAHEGVERRGRERRRPLTPDERASWTELRHLTRIRSSVGGDAAPWSPVL